MDITVTLTVKWNKLNHDKQFLLIKLSKIEYLSIVYIAVV